jgi:hypothetical protein
MRAPVSAGGNSRSNEILGGSEQVIAVRVANVPQVAFQQAVVTEFAEAGSKGRPPVIKKRPGLDCAGRFSIGDTSAHGMSPAAWLAGKT